MELPGYKSLVVLFGIIPMIVATLWGLFGFWTLKDWNWEVVLYFGAMDVGRTFIVWEQGMLPAGNNRTEELLFLTTPDSVWISLGSLRLAGKMAAKLQRIAMCNIVLVLAVSLYKHTKPLSRVLRLLGNQLALGVIDSQVQYDKSQYEEAWKYYFRLRKASIQMNLAFGGVIKCTHITNMFSLLVTLLSIVFGHQTLLTFLNSLYDVFLMLIFYILAIKVNQVVRGNICNVH